ncbi:unnamed protein product [Gadus morhua 'NCC']
MMENILASLTSSLILDVSSDEEHLMKSFWEEVPPECNALLGQEEHHRNNAMEIQSSFCDLRCTSSKSNKQDFWTKTVNGASSLNHDGQHDTDGRLRTTLPVTENVQSCKLFIKAAFRRLAWSPDQHLSSEDWHRQLETPAPLSPLAPAPNSRRMRRGGGSGWSHPTRPIDLGGL